MSRVPINELAAQAETRQNFVTDGAGGRRDIVDGNARADQRREVAAMNGAVRKIGYVDADEIHGNASDDRAAFCGDHRGTAWPLVGAAAGADEAVGVAERSDGDARGALGRPCGAIAHSLIARDAA